MRLVLRVLEETLWEIDGLIRSRIEEEEAYEYGYEYDEEEVKIQFRNPFTGDIIIPLGENRGRGRGSRGIRRQRGGGGGGDVIGLGILGCGYGYGVGVVGDFNGVMKREEDEERDLNLQARLKNKLDRIVRCVDSLFAYSDLLDQWFGAEGGG